MLRIPYNSLELDDKIGVNIKLSAEIYELLIEFCNWTENDLTSLVEYFIFDGIRSELSTTKGPEFKEAKELRDRIKELRSYF